ncbi:hypothetical protein OG379_41265 (plasmid) [Streptomyces sp. NBC_01166]|uniref:hypothetical protein n=1 Tax=Streptomyces sp. NBC_01166 TaxID=2903755 RepID=UPI002F911902|nr:hypothetical protein OG379_41265 [Streptomyces sp. NBC_01166]
MTGTIALSRHLDSSGLPTQAPPTQAYNHPRFLRAEPVPYRGAIAYHFTAFTGGEPEPQTPLAVYDDKGLTHDQRAGIRQQYESARILWSHARLRRDAVPALRRAAPLWMAWRAAERHLSDVFAAFWETDDNRWRAQLLRLVDAERAAQAAADAWDDIAHQLAQLADEQVTVAGYDEELPLETVATEIGLDISEWHIDLITSYTDRMWGVFTPVRGRAEQQIKAQRERLAQVDQMHSTSRRRSDTTSNCD